MGNTSSDNNINNHISNYNNYDITNNNNTTIDFELNFKHNLYELDKQCRIDIHSSNKQYIETIYLWCNNICVLPQLRNIKLLVNLPYIVYNNNEYNNNVDITYSIYQQSLTTSAKTQQQHEYILNTICNNKTIIQRILYTLLHNNYYNNTDILLKCVNILIQLIYDSHNRIQVLQSYNILHKLIDTKDNIKIQCGNNILHTTQQHNNYIKVYDILSNIIRIVDDRQYKQNVRLCFIKGLYSGQNKHILHKLYNIQCNNCNNDKHNKQNTHTHIHNTTTHNNISNCNGDYRSISNRDKTNNCVLINFASSPLYDQHLIQYIFSYVFHSNS